MNSLVLLVIEGNVLGLVGILELEVVVLSKRSIEFRNFLDILVENRLHVLIHGVLVGLVGDESGELRNLEVMSMLRSGNSGRRLVREHLIGTIKVLFSNSIHIQLDDGSGILVIGFGELRRG